MPFFSPGCADSLAGRQVRGGMPVSRAGGGRCGRAEMVQARIQPGSDRPLRAPEVLLDNHRAHRAPPGPAHTHTAPAAQSGQGKISGASLGELERKGWRRIRDGRGDVSHL